jgi:hypothetical protein
MYIVNFLHKFQMQFHRSLRNVRALSTFIDIIIKNRLLKVCYVPATSAASSRAYFLLFFCDHLQY